VNRAQHAQSDPRKPVWIALTVLRSFNDLLSQEFLYDWRLALAVEGLAGNVISPAQNLRRLGIKSPVSKKRYD